MAEPLAISVLKTKRAELASYVNHLKSELEQARADIVHIDATLRVFGCDDNPELFPAKRHPAMASLFPAGEIPRIALSMLRAHPEGLTCADIAKSIMEKEGWTDAGEAFRVALCTRVRQAMNRQRRRGTVETTGNKHERVWRIRR